MVILNFMKKHVSKNALLHRENGFVAFEKYAPTLWKRKKELKIDVFFSCFFRKMLSYTDENRRELLGHPLG